MPATNSGTEKATRPKSLPDLANNSGRCQKCDLAHDAKDPCVADEPLKALATSVVRELDGSGDATFREMVYQISESLETIAGVLAPSPGFARSYYGPLEEIRDELAALRERLGEVSDAIMAARPEPCSCGCDTEELLPVLRGIAAAIETKGTADSGPAPPNTSTPPVAPGSQLPPSPESRVRPILSKVARAEANRLRRLAESRVA